jgi:hypothetical protein
MLVSLRKHMMMMVVVVVVVVVVIVVVVVVLTVLVVTASKRWTNDCSYNYTLVVYGLNRTYPTPIKDVSYDMCSCCYLRPPFEYNTIVVLSYS